MNNKTKKIIIFASIIFIIGGIVTTFLYLRYKKSGGSSPNIPRKKFYGNWYYTYGKKCGKDGVECKVTLEKYLEPLNVQPNTAFYLGTGAYENEKIKDTYGSWSCVNRDRESVIFNNQTVNLKNQIINFGGYGCCSCTKWGTDIHPAFNLPNNYCDGKSTSTNPSITWTDELFRNLPSAAEIKSKGYTGVSLDIEAVIKGGMTGDGLKKKIDEWGNDIDIIITIPGNGVKDEFGGMSWFNKIKDNKNIYVCLMYYALINDTEKKDLGDLTDRGVLKTKLETQWSGDNSKYKLNPDQIILGLSFGQIDSPKNYLTEDILKLASGGISRWVEDGGDLSDCWK